MDLVKLDRQIPIKSIPEQELNKIILTQFTVWVANLLSLTDENSANRLETALPAIKEHCWSFGFSEIKKMFEMYADNKLSIEPIPNYFDRILLGKIVVAYKQQKQVPKKEIDYEKTIKQINKQHLIEFFKGYFLTGFINECHTIFIYDWLEQNGFIKLTKDEKLKLMKDAEILIMIETRQKGNLKDKLEGFTSKQIPNEEKIFNAKKIALKSFLKKLDENNVKEIELKIKSIYEDKSQKNS